MDTHRYTNHLSVNERSLRPSLELDDTGVHHLEVNRYVYMYICFYIKYINKYRYTNI